MRWREVDLDAGTWTIAKERCKNGKAHMIDLHPEAVALLDPLGDAAAPRLMQRTGEGEDLIYSTTGTTPVSGFSRAKGRIDARMRQSLATSSRNGARTICGALRLPEWLHWASSRMSSNACLTTSQGLRAG
jgi:hypothetical protein